MARFRSKTTGKNMSLEDAAKFLGTQKELFAIAFKPRKEGGARDEEGILAMCMANACRTVSTFYASTEGMIGWTARHYARMAGYFTATDDFCKKLAEDIRKTENYKFYLENANDAKQPRKAAKFKTKLAAMEAQLANVLQKLATTGNASALAAFYKKWHFRNKVNFTTAKEIDEAKINAAKLPNRAKKSKERILVPPKAMEKYVNEAKKRWGAFGSMFFQAGKQFHPALRLDKSIAQDRTHGAPVSRKFKPRSYEKSNHSARIGFCEVGINSDFVENRNNMRNSVQNACTSAEIHWADKAEEAIMIALEFEI